MADDDRDYIERTQSLSVNYTGKQMSPAEMAHEFAKWDIVTRVGTLESLSAEDGALTVKQAAERHAYKSALTNMHARLRKVGR
ncbi:hypothetical protein [Bradyrhizobium lablabi]|uniref:hypothetical protein n=1 Tax=Bradyrhizobium lablabi TaxID=722472 RepID=UPI00090B2D0A|nr:hypothetical protein [Bradyrhizobium lablabi]SHM40927.1 hypothetical protein SAMN05444321_6247 [Bradyrhizobium lablabi]